MLASRYPRWPLTAPEAHPPACLLGLLSRAGCSLWAREERPRRVGAGERQSRRSLWRLPKVAAPTSPPYLSSCLILTLTLTRSCGVPNDGVASAFLAGCGVDLKVEKPTPNPNPNPNPNLNPNPNPQA